MDRFVTKALAMGCAMVMLGGCAATQREASIDAVPMVGLSRPVLEKPFELTALGELMERAARGAVSG